MTFKVFVSDTLSEEGLYPLYEAKGIEVIFETGLSENELIDRLKDVDALLVRSQTKVTADIIENAKNLKVIGRAGVGVDNIDLKAATENGVIVVNAPNGNINSAAELIFPFGDRKSTRLNSSHVAISYAVFCLKKKKTTI